MKSSYITARRPLEVAREVEALLGEGCQSFVLRRLFGGGSLDLERLGAARYAAGVQGKVELDEGDSPAEPSRAAEAAAR